MEGFIHRRLVCESFSESFGALREFFSFFAPKQPNLREFERVFEKVSAALLLFFGAVVALISLFMPPEGEIDGSVLMLFAQILVYAGSIFGVKIYIKDLIKRANK